MLETDTENRSTSIAVFVQCCEHSVCHVDLSNQHEPPAKGLRDHHHPHPTPGLEKLFLFKKIIDVNFPRNYYEPERHFKCNV